MESHNAEFELEHPHIFADDLDIINYNDHFGFSSLPCKENSTLQRPKLLAVPPSNKPISPYADSDSVPPPLSPDSGGSSGSDDGATTMPPQGKKFQIIVRDLSNRSITLEDVTPEMKVKEVML